MPLELVRFDPDGPRVSVEIRCGHAQAGAYFMKLWEGNDRVQYEEGTFFDPSDDEYDLVGEAADQEGRLLQCTAEMEVIPPIRQFALIVTIRQGESRIGTLTAAGETDEPVVLRTVWARFEPEGTR